MRSLGLLLGLTIVLITVQPIEGISQAVPVIARADAAAIANDDEAFEEFLKSLPTVDIPGPLPRTFYVMEGDMKFTAEQVRAELLAHAIEGKSKSLAGSAGELKVMMKDGRPAIWAKGDRTLEYAIDRASFGQNRYGIIVEGMKVATAAWIDACKTCGVKFVHRAEYDAAPDISKTFIVAYKPNETKFDALAFFPYDERSLRYLWVAPSFFSLEPALHIGILKHELGHVLGYRHEHIGGVPGCQKHEEKDKNWKIVTSYDPRSVMHYFCGSGGMFDLTLTEQDRKGHAETYK